MDRQDIKLMVDRLVAIDCDTTDSHTIDDAITMLEELGGEVDALAALAAEVRRMRHRIECLRGALKFAAGRAYEVAEFQLGDDCMEWAGDLEPPLMGSNVDVTGAEPASSAERPR